MSVLQQQQSPINKPSVISRNSSCRVHLLLGTLESYKWPSLPEITKWLWPKVINEPASQHSIFSQILTVASHRDNKKYYEPRGRILSTHFRVEAASAELFLSLGKEHFVKLVCQCNRSFDTSSAAWGFLSEQRWKVFGLKSWLAGCNRHFRVICLLYTQYLTTRFDWGENPTVICSPSKGIFSTHHHYY